jgi:hypothetical protein
MNTKGLHTRPESDPPGSAVATEPVNPFAAAGARRWLNVSPEEKAAAMHRLAQLRVWPPLRRKVIHWLDHHATEATVAELRTLLNAWQADR